MLTACGCQANAEQTQILRPCQLHDQWARATYAPTSPYSAPAPDRRSTDATGSR